MKRLMVALAAAGVLAIGSMGAAFAQTPTPLANQFGWGHMGSGYGSGYGGGMMGGFGGMMGGGYGGGMMGGFGGITGPGFAPGSRGPVN